MESKPESTPETTPESVPETMPESIPESVPESTPEFAPDFVSEEVMPAPDDVAIVPAPTDSGSGATAKSSSRSRGIKKWTSRIIVIAAGLVVVALVVVLLVACGPRTVSYGQSYTWKDGPTCLVTSQGGEKENAGNVAVFLYCENPTNVTINTKYGRGEVSRQSFTDTGVYTEMIVFAQPTTVAILPEGFPTVTWK